jgi:hypothetical protein
MATDTSSMTRCTTAEYARQVSAPTAATTLTKVLMACGIVFGPLFYVVAIVQMAIGAPIRRR